MTPSAAPADTRPLTDRVRRWYRAHGRDLPWRSPGTTPWQVLVSEVMLAQTPVARVVPAYLPWVGRWPDAASTAAAPPADLIRAWGRLGYPRRALRLRQAAEQVVARHGGTVPHEREALLALPGVGEYTAAAVIAFAHGRRIAVLDTNVRRVLARALAGEERAGAHITVAERQLAAGVLPASDPAAAEWSVAVMELGALVCTAAAPRCEECPIRNRCAWWAAGRPRTDPPRRAQAWHGTDRQCRGRLMAALRASARPLTAEELAGCWDDAEQRDRCLRSLTADGLVAERGGRFGLPGD